MRTPVGPASSFSTSIRNSSRSTLHIIRIDARAAQARIHLRCQSVPPSSHYHHGNRARGCPATIAETCHQRQTASAHAPRQETGVPRFAIDRTRSTGRRSIDHRERRPVGSRHRVHRVGTPVSGHHRARSSRCRNFVCGLSWVNTRSPSFVHEYGFCFVFREFFGEYLDRNGAVELRVASAINLAHAPFADGGADLIRPEARSGGEGHRRQCSGSTGQLQPSRCVRS